MSLASKSLLRGVKRIFSLPRLSLSLVIALGATLGAVLCVTAIVSALIVKPLPGVSNAPLLKDFDLGITFGGSLRLDFITPHVLNHANNYFKDIGEFSAVEPSRTSISINDVNYAVTALTASTNAPSILGTTLIKGAMVDNKLGLSDVWISKSFWETSFKGLDSAIGQAISIDDKQYIIAGVLEDTLAISSNVEILPNQLWFFTDYTKAIGFMKTENIGNNSLKNIILKPHSADIKLPSNEEVLQWFNGYVENNITVQSIQNFVKTMPMESNITDYRVSFLEDNYYLVIALSITSLGLLLMATLNLINLFLSYYQSRSKEFAIQLSLGATPLKLKVLMMLENLPSFALSGIFGTLLGAWLIKALPVFTNNKMPLLNTIEIDGITLIFASLLVISLSAIFGMLSLTHINRHNLQANLNSSGKGTAGQSKNTISRALMIIQLSIASILMTGSVMFAESAYDSVNEDLGFEMGNTHQLTFNVINEQWLESLSNTPTNGTIKRVDADNDPMKNAYRSFITQLSQDTTSLIPDSKIVLVNSGGLLSGEISIRSSSLIDNPEEQLTYSVHRYDVGYFEAMNIPVLAGTPLTSDEITNKTNKVMIDERYAKALYPNVPYDEIIGQLLPTSSEKVVGAIVVETGFSMARIAPATYTPYYSISSLITLNIAIPDGASLDIDELKPYFDKHYPQLELAQAQSTKSTFREMTGSKRITLYILIAVTMLTILLAGIGIAGLTLMTTHQKKYELAIRMATGARQSNLVKLITKDTFSILIIGLVIAFAISVFGYEPLQQEITLLPQFNWLTLVSLDIGLVLVVLLSVLIPTWRVIKQDPLSALRQE